MKFTQEDIGKVVVVTGDMAMYPFEEATICKESHASIGHEWIGVEIDDGIHDCSGTCEMGRGVWVYAGDFTIKEC